MKKIPPTPFARRNLDNQLAALQGDPNNWRPEHLRRAYQILENRVGPETAKGIVIQSVRAADRALKEASQVQLRETRQSALVDFSKNCRAIANGTKPNRLGKEVRMHLNQVARSAFAAGAADLETVQEFFWECKKIVELLPQDKAASAIFKHLVTDKDDRTHGKVPLEGNSPKIALDYEVLPPEARSGCESGLAELLSKSVDRLSAHDVFARLHSALLDLELATQFKAEPDIIHDYLAELDGLWTDQGLDVGRGNDPADPHYRSPFQEFAERVLLEQRNPRSRLFTPASEQELHAAREEHRKLPKEWQEITSAAPFRGTPLITDWTLRTYLDRRPVFKKSE